MGCNDDVTIRYMGCNDDVTTRCTDLDIDIDKEVDVDVDVDAVTAPVTPGRVHDDNLMAYFMGKLERAVEREAIACHN